MSLVFSGLSDSHRGCDSALTHPTSHPISPSIKRRRQQWVRRPQAARTIGGSDRWSHQRCCQDDTQTSPLSFPLSTLFASYQSPLPTSPQTPVWRGEKKMCRWKEPFFTSNRYICLLAYRENCARSKIKLLHETDEKRWRLKSQKWDSTKLTHVIKRAEMRQKLMCEWWKKIILIY